MLTTFKQNIESFRLIPSGGGRFEVVVDSDLIYSKLATGQFPDESAIVDLVRQR